MIKIERYKKGDVTVVVPCEPLDINTHKMFRDELTGLIDTGAMAILVDLSSVDHVTSTGLSALLSTARRMEEISGKFAICSPSDNTLRVFELSGFMGIMNIYPSVDSAMDYLR